MEHDTVKSPVLGLAWTPGKEQLRWQEKPQSKSPKWLNKNVQPWRESHCLSICYLMGVVCEKSLQPPCCFHSGGEDKAHLLPSAGLHCSPAWGRWSPWGLGGGEQSSKILPPPGRSKSRGYTETTNTLGVTRILAEGEEMNSAQMQETLLELRFNPWSPFSGGSKHRCVQAPPPRDPLSGSQGLQHHLRPLTCPISPSKNGSCLLLWPRFWLCPSLHSPLLHPSCLGPLHLHNLQTQGWLPLACTPSVPWTDLCCCVSAFSCLSFFLPYESPRRQGSHVICACHPAQPCLSESKCSVFGEWTGSGWGSSIWLPTVPAG